MSAQRRAGRPRQCPDEVRDRVIRLRGEGWSLRRIAEQMNEAGLPTPRGSERWNHNTVDRLLATRHVRELIDA